MSFYVRTPFLVAVFMAALWVVAVTTLPENVPTLHLSALGGLGTLILTLRRVPK